ncbi:hypothetical protein DBT53_004435, partial [Aerococcus mictus]|uniref:hypothetical protein n=1 Tax=Aerococcus mictus TaxID=2976810 RepID=UPI002FD11D8E
GDLATGPAGFTTAAVRRAVTTLAGDAVALKANGGEPWLDDVLSGVRAVLDLVDKAESDIIDTANQAQRQLEAIVTRPGFMPSAEIARGSPDADMDGSDEDLFEPSAASAAE